MSRNVVVIGRGMFGRALAAEPAAAGYRFLSHVEAMERDALAGADCIVNLAVHPDYWSQPYREEVGFDFDLTIASRIAGRGIHYIAASSRKVYDPKVAFGAREDSELGPTENYGKNKVITEKKLQSMLGQDLTILRFPNVIGFDENWVRPIFFTHLLKTLKEQSRIIFDVSPFTRRDFIPDESIAQCLIRIVDQRVTGLFNLGSGHATPVGHLALWTIKGYGQGDLLVTSPDVRDEFLMDVGKLSALIGPTCTVDDIERKCWEMGKRLRHA